MPSAQLKSFAKKSDKSLADLERYWDEAKKEAMKKFGKKNASFWKYVVGIVERRAGLRKVSESLTFSDFLHLEQVTLSENNKAPLTVGLLRRRIMRSTLSQSQEDKIFAEIKNLHDDQQLSKEDILALSRATKIAIDEFEALAHEVFY